MRKFYFCTAIKFTYLYSLALTWKIEHEGGKRPKTSLRGTSIQKYEIAQNCPFFPSLPSLFPRWSHFIVLKNLRWSLEMYSEVIVSSYFHSVSQSCPILSTNCTFRKWFYVCFVYFAAIAQGWWINLRSFIFILYIFLHIWCERGAKSHVAKEISERGRTRSREKGNQGVGDVRFINILQLNFFYLFFLIALLHHFFPYLFYPRNLPTPTTHAPRHLATLVSSHLLSKTVHSLRRSNVINRLLMWELLRQLLLTKVQKSMWWNIQISQSRRIISFLLYVFPVWTV